MSKKKIILALTNGFWFIEQQAAISLGEAVASVMAGNSAWDDDNFDSEKNKEKKLLDKILLIGSDHTPYVAKDASFSNANAGSVAIINIDGPVMKNDNCGDPGMQTYERLIKSADNNPNISAIILQIDSPGGTVAGTQSLADVIKSTSKPIVSLADDLMASAAYWFGSSSDYVMAKNSTTRIGSIGTMMSFADAQPYWEAQGVKFHDIYADASKDKNAAFADARKGNYDKYKTEVLNPLNDQFLASVKNNRSGKLDLKKENVLTGKVYLAQDAVNNGLIDSIGNLDAAIAKAFELAADPAQLNASTEKKPNPTNMKKILVSCLALCSILSAKGHEKPEELEALNDDHLKALNDGFTEITAANKKQADDLTANATKIDELTAKNAELQSTIEAHEAKIAELGKANPGATTSKKDGDVEETGSDDDQFMTSVDREAAELEKKGLR